MDFGGLTWISVDFLNVCRFIYELMGKFYTLIVLCSGEKIFIWSDEYSKFLEERPTVT